MARSCCYIYSTYETHSKSDQTLLRWRARLGCSDCTLLDHLRATKMQYVPIGDPTVRREVRRLARTVCPMSKRADTIRGQRRTRCGPLLLLLY